MLIGAMKHGLKGIDETQARDMCLRVGIGMFNVGLGGTVADSLDSDALNDDEAMRAMWANIGARLGHLRSMPVFAALEGEQPALEEGAIEAEVVQ